MRPHAPQKKKRKKRNKKHDTSSIHMANFLFFVCFLPPLKGLTHEEAARIIANSYADRSVPELKLLMSPSTFRPNANYQPENWWWNTLQINSLFYSLFFSLSTRSNSDITNPPAAPAAAHSYRRHVFTTHKKITSQILWLFISLFPFE